LRRKFTNRRVASARAGIKRFYKVWEEINQERVNQAVDAYPKRPHECINKY
jgi:hypothetical protein